MAVCLRQSLQFRRESASAMFGTRGQLSSISGGILWYPIESKIISSFWDIVFYTSNIILSGSTTKNATQLCQDDRGLGVQVCFT